MTDRERILAWLAAQPKQDTHLVQVMLDGKLIYVTPREAVGDSVSGITEEARRAARRAGFIVPDARGPIRRASNGQAVSPWRALWEIWRNRNQSLA